MFLTLAAFVSLVAGCGSGESQEEIATGVARTWVNTSIDDVSDTVVTLVIGEAPLLSQIAGEALAKQVHDNVAWSYSTPKREGEDKYQVTVTASVTLRVEIPLLGTKAYVASLPFILDVDTNTKTVERWSPNALSATVEEQSE